MLEANVLYVHADQMEYQILIAGTSDTRTYLYLWPQFSCS